MADYSQLKDKLQAAKGAIDACLQSMDTPDKPDEEVSEGDTSAQDSGGGGGKEALKSAIAAKYMNK